MKQLLESGTYLHRPMLAGVVQHIADFVHGCGLVRHNRHILPIVTFIRKCVGVSDDEFRAMLDEHGIRIVVFDPAASLPLPAGVAASLRPPSAATGEDAALGQPSRSVSILGADAALAAAAAVSAAEGRRSHSRSQSRGSAAPSPVGKRPPAV